MPDTTIDDPQTFAIIGAAMTVHAEMGRGFLEAVYREALTIELRLRGIPFAKEVPLPVVYRGVQLCSHYRVDFVCYDDVLVEVKAVDSLGPVDRRQTLNYLRAARRERALLLNFGAPSLQYRRIVFGGVAP